MKRKTIKQRFELAQQSPLHAEIRLYGISSHGAATVEGARTLSVNTTRDCFIHPFALQTNRCRCAVGAPPLSTTCIEALTAIQVQCSTCCSEFRQIKCGRKSQNVDQNKDYSYRIVMPTSFAEFESLTLRWKYWKHLKKTYQLLIGAYGHRKFAQVVTQLYFPQSSRLAMQCANTLIASMVSKRGSKQWKIVSQFAQLPGTRVTVNICYSFRHVKHTNRSFATAY
jgi:hypothetical protein